MLPIRKPVTVAIPEPLTVLKVVIDGEVLAVPLLPGGGGSSLVVGDSSPHVGGQHEPTGPLPVPDNVKVSDT